VTTTHRIVTAARVIVLLAACLSCGEIEVGSSWADAAPAIDGSASEWQGSLFYFESPHAFVGVRNDEEFLYLCLTTPDPNVAREVWSRGLRLRVGADGRDPLEIRFPLGIDGSGPPAEWDRGGPLGPERGRPPDRGEGPERGAGPGRREPPAAHPMRAEAFELVAPGSEAPQRVPAENLLGIEPRVGTEENSFVYEIRLPLQAGDAFPYAVGAVPGSRIRVAIEEGEAMRSAERPEGPGGRMGERGGGPGGGGMGGPGGPGAESRPKSTTLKLRLGVLLASAPVGAPPSSDTPGPTAPSPK